MGSTNSRSMLLLLMLSMALLSTTCAAQPCKTRPCLWRQIHDSFDKVLRQFDKPAHPTTPDLADTEEDMTDLLPGDGSADDGAGSQSITAKEACGSMCVWKGKREEGDDEEEIEATTAAEETADSPQQAGDEQCTTMACRVWRSMRAFYKKAQGNEAMTSYRCNRGLCHWRMGQQ